VSEIQSAENPLLYQEVARDILDLIGQGTYQAGDRIPSIRAMSQRLAVSINTIKAAYSQLEVLGKVESRPGAGYYISPQLPPPVDTGRHVPVQHFRDMNPSKVNICQVYGEMQDEKSSPGASLAIALPSADLLPGEKLQRSFYRAWKEQKRDCLSYSISPGVLRLREQIAHRLAESGARVKASEIIITNGCSEAIVLSLMTLCKPGDVIAVETPTYFNSLQLLKELDVRILEIPCHPVTGMNLEVLSFALEQHSIKAVLSISNFNNPLGSLIPDENKKHLVELLHRHRVPLIEDDVYGELTFGKQRPRTWFFQDHCPGIPGGLGCAGPALPGRGPAQEPHEHRHRQPQPVGHFRLPGGQLP